MKKSVLFVALLLLMTNFVFAQHSVCDPMDDASISGVYMDGQCFNCGFDEGGPGMTGAPGICPEQFGADCTLSPDPDCLVEYDQSELLDFYWSLDGLTPLAEDTMIGVDLNGKTLYLVAENTELSDGPINFNVFEYDGLIFSDDLGIVAGIVVDGKATATFQINNEADLQEGGVSEPDYYTIYFTIPSHFGAEESEKINVNFSVGIPSAASTCADYGDNDSCIENLEGVEVSEGVFEGYPTEGSICERRIDLVGCEWDEGTTTCKTAPDVIVYPTDPQNPSSCNETLTSCNYAETGKTDCGGGEDFFKVSYTSSTAGCEGWISGAIPCPQELKVPFFGAYGFLMSLCFISLIYVYLIFKRK